MGKSQSSFRQMKNMIFFHNILLFTENDKWIPEEDINLPTTTLKV